MNTPNDDRLIRALRASRDARLTGALRVETDRHGGTLFFDSGQIYFAVVDGCKPTTASFAQEGITRQMLEGASAAPRSEDRFADALMNVGARGPAVRAFGRRSITFALTRLADLSEARFTADDRRHPYGPAFTFDVEDLLEATGLTETQVQVDVTTNQSVEEPAPIPQETGLGLLRRRTGLKAAALAAQEG